MIMRIYKVTFNAGAMVQNKKFFVAPSPTYIVKYCDGNNDYGRIMEIEEIDKAEKIIER